jgi:MFS superfamily sulfate permease-like transporter
MFDLFFMKINLDHLFFIEQLEQLLRASNPFPQNCVNFKFLPHNHKRCYQYYSFFFFFSSLLLITKSYTPTWPSYIVYVSIGAAII